MIMTDSPQRVLLVDDEDDIRMVAEIALRDVGGFDTMTAESGEQALTKAVENPPPDVILLDMMMPQMDGLETLIRLQMRPETREIPVIFMTAKAQTAEIEKYVAAGALGVITKPFDPMTLADQVRGIVADGGA